MLSRLISSCILQSIRLSYVSSGDDQSDQQVRRPRINKPAGQTADDEYPQSDLQSTGVGTDRSRLEFAHVKQRRSKQTHEADETEQPHLCENLHKRVMNDELGLAST